MKSIINTKAIVLASICLNLILTIIIFNALKEIQVYNLLLILAVLLVLTTSFYLVFASFRGKEKKLSSESLLPQTILSFFFLLSSSLIVRTSNYKIDYLHIAFSIFFFLTQILNFTALVLLRPQIKRIGNNLNVRYMWRNIQFDICKDNFSIKTVALTKFLMMQSPNNSILIPLSYLNGAEQELLNSELLKK